jgi:hypothetical protein
MIGARSMVNDYRGAAESWLAAASKIGCVADVCPNQTEARPRVLKHPFCRRQELRKRHHSQSTAIHAYAKEFRDESI